MRKRRKREMKAKQSRSQHLSILLQSQKNLRRGWHFSRHEMWEDTIYAFRLARRYSTSPGLGEWQPRVAGNERDLKTILRSPTTVQGKRYPERQRKKRRNVPWMTAWFGYWIRFSVGRFQHVQAFFQCVRDIDQKIPKPIR